MNKEKLEIALRLKKTDFGFEKNLTYGSHSRSIAESRYNFIKNTFQEFHNFYSEIFEYGLQIIESQNNYCAFINGDKVSCKRNGYPENFYETEPIVKVSYYNSTGGSFLNAMLGGVDDITNFKVDYRAEFAGFNGSDYYCYNDLAISNHINQSLLKAITRTTYNSIGYGEMQELLKLTYVDLQKNN